jgi:hypothetical protein
MPLFPIHSLSNFDIEDYLTELNIKHKVVPKGKLPKRPPPPNAVYIINLDDTTGTHWVALLHKRGSSDLLYYDSYGVDYPPQRVMDYKARILANNSQHQALDSILCGYYVLRVIKSVLGEGKTYKEAMSEFTDTPSASNQELPFSL